MRAWILALCVVATVLFSARANAESVHVYDGYAFRPRSMPALGIVARVNHVQTSLAEAPGLYGGGAYAHFRINRVLAVEGGMEGFGGSFAQGYLVGGYGLPLSPHVLLYATARSRLQPYLIVSWNVETQFLRGGADIPKEARPGFIYSGPTGGIGIDIHVEKHWAMRFELRAFWRMRGYSDDELRKQNPTLADATRSLTGFIVTTGPIYFPASY